ncbi:hypothetical protein [Rhizobium sp. L1K21]|uniref:COG3904 family protein n=1 Tax=Rhizobium sp. L1K21 TaxID=2954933 RepID=UPI002092DC35|nr:hypothetical protein [Rhizobium sp. L1K21]MCO6187477.1 hypothetical protein [Rhizobium sp. L1K21]
MLWSFAVNLVALRAVIFLVQGAFRPDEYEDYFEQSLLVLALAVFFHGIVFIWQAVGVFRAGENYIRDRGAIAVHWGAQLGVLVAFWLTASYALNAWQMTVDVPDYIDYEAKWRSEREARYALTREDGDTLKLAGTLELGITKRLTALFQEKSAPYRIILSSKGGNIYEARGLEKLFRERGIDTIIEDECSSACTTAFIGGKKRWLKPGGRLGFHQYRVEADYAVLGSDPKAEQKRDEALFLNAGVKPDFAARMHSAAANSMWYPSSGELLSAGVVTDILE